jgi:hypothetical protein
MNPLVNETSPDPLLQLCGADDACGNGAEISGAAA